LTHRFAQFLPVSTVRPKRPAASQHVDLARIRFGSIPDFARISQTAFAS
jgi:hypothetical protein